MGTNSKNNSRYHEVNDEPVQRVCLTCRSEFTANGRFNRICDGCKNLVSMKSGPDVAAGRSLMRGKVHSD